MKRNEILGEHKKGTKAVKYNKKPKDHTAEFSKAKEKLAPVKPMEESRWDRRDAYQRDYDSSVAGMGKRQSLAYQLDGGANDEGWDEEPRQRRHSYSTPKASHTQSSGMYFYNVPHGKEDDARAAGLRQSKNGKWYSKSQISSKEFGQGRFWQPKNEATGDALGTVSSTTPDGQVSIKTTTGAEIKTDQSALMPGANGTVQMKPDAAGDTLKPGAKVVSTEEIGIPPTTDSSSPINGDEENVDLRRLRELAGQPVSADANEMPAGVDPAAAQPPGEIPDNITIDNAEDFKDGARKALISAGVDQDGITLVDKMVVADADGSVNIEGTFRNIMAMAGDYIPQVVKMFEELISTIESAMTKPEFNQLSQQEKEDIISDLRDMKAKLPALQKQARELSAQMKAAEDPQQAQVQAAFDKKAGVNREGVEHELAEMLRIAGIRK